MESNNVCLEESSKKHQESIDDLDKSMEEYIQSSDQIDQSIDSIDPLMVNNIPSIDLTNETIKNESTNDANPIRACIIMAESGTNKNPTRPILKNNNFSTTFSTFSCRKMSDLQLTTTQVEREAANSGSGDELMLHSAPTQAAGSSSNFPSLFTTSRNDQEESRSLKAAKKAENEHQQYEKARQKYERHQDKRAAKKMDNMISS